MISFATLYIITTYIILPRIRENIRLRKNKIANDLERADAIKVEIEKMIKVWEDLKPLTVKEILQKNPNYMNTDNYILEYKNF